MFLGLLAYQNVFSKQYRDRRVQRNFINNKTNNPAKQQCLFPIQILKVTDFNALSILPPTC